MKSSLSWQVDDQAEDLIAQAGKEELDRQKGHEKSFRSALKKIRGINMAFPGMANMFDISMSRIDVLTVARTFGNENYLSCTQLRQVCFRFSPLFLSSHLHASAPKHGETLCVRI